MNYFAHQTAAERYARSRPYVHPLVIDRIRTFLKLDGPIPVALDVACGTGQSALALTDIAVSVIAADLSPAMLAHAPVHPRIRYLEAPAEQLPLENHSADLITVALAFHWLDRARFLAEAHRLLRPGGALVIYWNACLGRMSENPDFARWYREVYLARYPMTPRNAQPFTDQDARESSFIFAGRESYTTEGSYTHEITFSPEQFVQHLLTHSNMIAAVEERGEPLSEVQAWLLDSMRPFFRAATGSFIFGGEIWFLQPLPKREAVPPIDS